MRRKITLLFISLMLIIASIGFTAPVKACADAPIEITPSSTSVPGCYTILTDGDGAKLTIIDNGTYTVSGTWYDVDVNNSGSTVTFTASCTITDRYSSSFNFAYGVTNVANITNYGNINWSEGWLYANYGTIALVNLYYVSHNYGTITLVNSGTDTGVFCNENSGTINDLRGEMITNSGTIATATVTTPITTNSGTITEFDGNITTNTGTITTFSYGVITTNTGTIESCSGQVGTNSGVIFTLDFHGKVTSNFNTIHEITRGRVITNSGTIRKLSDEGTVTTNSETGRIYESHGIITNNNGFSTTDPAPEPVVVSNNSPEARYMASLDEVSDKISETFEKLNKGDNKVEKTIYFSSGDSLPVDVMKTLKKCNGVTLDFVCTYEDKKYHFVIKGGDAMKLDETIPWYGPLYLASIYGVVAE